MARPAMKEENKRKSLSVSLRPDVCQMAQDTGNSSQFLERSVEVCLGLKEIMRGIKDGTIKKASGLEELEDIIDAWEAQFDESMELSKAFPKAK